MMSLEEARATADRLRVAMPETAAAIDRLVAEAAGRNAESVNVRVEISYRLEKFHGDYQPGMEPFEVIEGTDSGDQP